MILVGPRQRHTLWLLLRCFALAALTACNAFDSSADRLRFPDAGPGGPDSLYAGVGQGIPFGEFSLSPEQFGAPYTAAALSVSRDNAAQVLRAGRDGRLRLVLHLAGAGDAYRREDGTFDLAAWKAQIDRYRDVDFTPYVTEGLVLAHNLVDEPNAAGTWGGRPISRADVEEMARYSKSIWPSLPTAVRAPPSWLVAGDTTYRDLDIAWAQWAGPDHGAGSGHNAESFRDQMVGQAKQLGLGLIFGLNYLNGGDGSSGIHGTAEHPDQWQMSAAEVAGVGALLAETPYVCAFISWRHDPAFESRPEIRAALDSVAAVAATRGGTSCLRHSVGDSSGAASAIE